MTRIRRLGRAVLAQALLATLPYAVHRAPPAAFATATPCLAAELGGLVVFALGSLACALAPGMTWLILGRALQGLSGTLENRLPPAGGLRRQCRPA